MGRKFKEALKDSEQEGRGRDKKRESVIPAKGIYPAAMITA